MEAIDKDGVVICAKSIKFWSGWNYRKKEPEYIVDINSDEKYNSADKTKLIKITFRITDENKKPVKNIPVKFSFYETRLWEQVSGEKNTDKNGIVEIDYYIREPGYIIIAGGVDYKHKDFVKNFGAIKFIEILE